MTHVYTIYYPWGYLVYHKSEKNLLNSQYLFKKKKPKLWSMKEKKLSLDKRVNNVIVRIMQV